MMHGTRPETGAFPGMSAMDDRVPPVVPASATRSDAFDRYVLPEIELLLRVARSLTRNDADADDLVQDTLLRAHRSIETFDGRYPRAWLLTILRNTHINRQRRQRPELLRDPDTPDRVVAATGPLADDFIEQSFDAEIERALAELPEPFRQVIELVDIRDLSYATAAEMTGVPVGTVMSRLHRARTRIRKHLLQTGVAPRSKR